MLGTEDQIFIGHVVDEIVKSRMYLDNKLNLLESLMQYEGHNDNFKKYIDKAKIKLTKHNKKSKEFLDMTWGA